MATLPWYPLLIRILDLLLTPPLTCESRGRPQRVNLVRDGVPMGPLDAKCASWNITLMAIFEIVVVAQVYGTDRLFQNISEMEMQFPWVVKMFWWLCWKFVTPALLMVMMALTFMDKSMLKYNNYEFPYSVQVAGWIIGTSSVIFIPLFALYAYVLDKHQ